MKKTSINIQPVKGGSEDHNLRTKPLDYVRNDLTDKNESIVSQTIENRLNAIKKNYRETTGQRMQKKATPIREGVIVIDEKTTMDDLMKFSHKCQERFGIKAFQLHIHRDEGHYRGGEWKPNHHAHIVFDWTDDKGKSIKLNRQDMAEMQTILAESLNMQRGESSDKKHIKALQFKNLKEEEHLRKLEAEQQKAAADIRHKEKILKNKPLEAEIKAEFEKRLLSRSEVAKVDKNDLKTLVERNNYLELSREKLIDENYNLKNELQETQKKYDQYKTSQSMKNYDIDFHVKNGSIKLVNAVLKKLNIPKKMDSNYQLKNLTAREMKNRL